VSRNVAVTPFRPNIFTTIIRAYTTGIWMWSEPFIRTTTASGGEKLAVLLMDTQGMFDNETTMTLTAQIFGLSTLVSSFQVCIEY